MQGSEGFGGRVAQLTRAKQGQNEGGWDDAFKSFFFSQRGVDVIDGAFDLSGRDFGP